MFPWPVDCTSGHLLTYVQVMFSRSVDCTSGHLLTYLQVMFSWSVDCTSGHLLTYLQVMFHWLADCTSGHPVMYSHTGNVQAKERTLNSWINLNAVFNLKSNTQAYPPRTAGHVHVLPQVPVLQQIRSLLFLFLLNITLNQAVNMCHRSD